MLHLSKKNSGTKTGTVHTDFCERRHLLKRADDFGRANTPVAYRNEHADNSHLLDLRPWIGAFKADSDLLMLSITPFDDELAALSFIRIISTDPATSDTRYLLSKMLVEHLSALGVPRLAETANAAHLQNGLRHFQRMVGFRIEPVNVKAVRIART